MTVAETLIKAANLLSRRQWTQGVYAKRNGNPCTPDAQAEQYDGLGAIRCVSKQPFAVIELVNRKCELDHKQTFAEWNDAFGRTKVEVVRYLRELAKRL